MEDAGWFVDEVQFSAGSRIDSHVLRPQLWFVNHEFEPAPTRW